MNPLVLEWIEKADGDFRAAGRELRARKQPAFHVVCFLSQQCVEKYLKAFLEQNKKHIPKIHDLIELLELCKETDTSFEILRSDLEELEKYAVRVRYPGTIADKDDARTAYKAAKIIRKVIRQKLDIPETT